MIYSVVTEFADRGTLEDALVKDEGEFTFKYCINTLFKTLIPVQATH